MGLEPVASVLNESEDSVDIIMAFYPGNRVLLEGLISKSA
jgi:hypothetical protein